VDQSSFDLNKQVFINGRFLTQPVSGVQRYAFELIQGLDLQLQKSPDLRQRLTFTLLLPHDVQSFPVLHHITVKKVGRFSGHLWEQLELPFHSRKGLLAGFCNTGPLLKRKQIVTLCDASVYRVPQAYSLAFRFWYRAQFAMLGLWAKRLLTISNFSRDELVSCCAISPEKFSVIYPGADHFSRQAEKTTPLPDAFSSSDRPFVLAVSSMSPHKNFKALVQAAALLGETDFDLLIAGGTNPAVFRSAELPLPETVKHLGYVSDEQLKALYAKAACFVYPSLYEGFGLPPLEAMGCGCPVIVARAGSLPEVCGDAALYCDPTSAEDIADQIKTVMRDNQLRDALRANGLERVKAYTWEKCACQTMKAVENAADR
jgi:glycosyltransferase involved in cell wall biosynthesis